MAHKAERISERIFKVVLKTAGKTEEELLNQYEGPKSSDQFIKEMKKAYDSLDGLEILAMKSFVSDGYIVIAWEEDDDPLIRDFIYQAEQDEYYGTYVDEREEFLKDWKTGDYSPMGSLSFSEKEIEIIEEAKKKECNPPCNSSLRDGINESHCCKEVKD